MGETMKKFDDIISHLNPFEEISTDTGPVLPEHVDQFIKDKRNIEHKKKEDQMVKNWKDEIAINKGGK
jgi:hypothetical protein